MLEEVSQAAEVFYPGVKHEDISFEELAEKLGNPRYSALANYIRNNWMAATSSDHCSLADIESDPHSSGGLVVEGGMSTYVDELADEAGRDKIRTNTKIVSLEETPHDVIAKDAQGNRYLAKHVILTPSVGVLKSGAIKVEGQAGDTLTKQLDGYQMGEMFKMTFELPKEMFARNKHRTNRRFIVLPSDQRPALCITGNPDNPTLTILCGGEAGHEMERASGPQQLAYACSVVGMAQGLKDMLPYLKDEPHVTGWSKNPLVQGAYATKRLGFKGHDAPCWIGSRIIVAGEAFHPQVGYLDSALVSGEKAATEVAERLAATGRAVA